MSNLAPRRPRFAVGLALAALVTSAAIVGTGEGARAAADAAAPAADAGVRAAGPGYATILFGRSQWVQTTNDCRPATNAVPLDRVARDLTARRLRATVNVVVDRTQETTRKCHAKYTLHTSWADLRTLRSTHGWGVISAGQTYANMDTLTPQQQYAESCGSLSAFTSRGHTNAWGMFAYPNNSFSTEAQANAVSRCFAYGRTYRAGPNDRATTVAPWLQNTTSVNGGRCNDPTLACYTAPVANNRRYAAPQTLRNLFASATADRWVAVQFYRLVSGRGTASTFSWDCSSPDWRAHTTSNPELYCYNDFLTAIGGIPAAAVVADPATVARAWGRIPPE